MVTSIWTAGGRAGRTARCAASGRGEDDEHGHLVHHRGHHWAFHYAGQHAGTGENDEPIFRFDGHRFVVGDYVSVTEHDGVQRTFRIAAVAPFEA